MLNYDGNYLSWQYNTFSFLHPNNKFRSYYAKKNVVGFKTDIAVYTAVGIWILMQKCIGI